MLRNRYDGAATGLIWSLGTIVIGAVMFHVGVLAFLVLAWRDDAVRLPIIDEAAHGICPSGL